MRQHVLRAALLSCVAPLFVGPAATGGPPPDWAAPPSLAIVDVWPDPIILPGPIVVTVKLSAPVDNYAIAPPFFEDEGLLFLFWATLQGADSKVIAEATKSPDFSPGVYLWRTPIPPGGSLSRELLLLWRKVDEKFLASTTDGERTGTLTVQSDVPIMQAKKINRGEPIDLTATAPVRIRAEWKEGSIARALFEERLLYDRHSLTWAAPGGSGERRLTELVQEHPAHPLGQLIRGILLWHKLHGSGSPLHEDSASARVAELAPGIDQYVHDCPSVPLADNLLYNLQTRQLLGKLRERTVKAAAHEAELIAIADRVGAQLPGGDISANAWFLRKHDKLGWPSSRPASSQPAR